MQLSQLFLPQRSERDKGREKEREKEGWRERERKREGKRERERGREGERERFLKGMTGALALFSFLVVNS
jgi:hypothetical protein